MHGKTGQVRDGRSHVECFGCEDVDNLKAKVGLQFSHYKVWEDVKSKDIYVLKIN